MRCCAPLSSFPKKESALTTIRKPQGRDKDTTRPGLCQEACVKNDGKMQEFTGALRADAMIEPVEAGKNIGNKIIFNIPLLAKTK